MKTVGQQLQEARQAKNWPPELAARETKIRVERLRDLEADDYTHFTSPTYARGFVRTYARALGLDEYKILRQLDNKLPEDDNATMITDSGVSYMPEPSESNRAPIGSNPAIYIVMALGSAVMLIIAFVVFQAYRAGELSSYLKPDSTAAATASLTPVSTNSEADTAPKAVPVDPNAIDTSHAAKATPVDLGPTVSTSSTNASDTMAVAAPVVSPTDANAASTNSMASTDPTTPKEAPRALPVDPNELAAATSPAVTAAAIAPPVPTTTSARQSNAGPVHLPPAPAQDAPVTSATVVVAAQQVPTPDASVATGSPGERRLILTASRDSFVRVTALDRSGQVLYASVLRTGQSIGFDQRKYSVNVGIPAAVEITLDGVNYGPHSDMDSPETFTVESHQP